MLQPMAGNAQALLTRVVEQVGLSNGGKLATDDVAAVAVRRAN